MSEIGAKEVFFDGRRDASAQPMTAETNKGKAMIMPVLVENISIEEDGRVVVGNSNTAFLYDLADKKPINDFAKKLGAKGVHIISDKEQLPSTEGSAYRAISSGSKIMGWYNPQTDQLYIYAPYAK